MMNLSEFIEYAGDHIKDYLPPDYQGADIRLDTVKKTNEQYQGMTVSRGKNGSVPVLNMELFYQEYAGGMNMDEVLGEMAEVVQMEPQADIDIDIMRDYENVKDKLFVRLSSVEGNEDILADSPYQMAADMAMTYHIHIPAIAGDGFMSARITNEMMEQFGITQEQLHQDAIVNTGRIFEPQIVSMGAMPFVDEDSPFLIITNKEKLLGASALFCEGVMDQVAEEMKGNYFVLPSSQHEMLAVPDNGEFERAVLEKMVRDANRTVVDAPDRLSDTVYHYDQQDRIFERAGDYEKRTQVKTAEKDSLLGRLQDKKEQVERSKPAIGMDRHRQRGLALS